MLSCRARPLSKSAEQAIQTYKGGKMAKKNLIIPLAASIMLFSMQPAFADDINCHGAFMSALSNIAALPLSALQSVQQFLLTPGQVSCSCNNAQANTSTSVMSAPAQTVMSVPAMPAYVTYQVMQPVQPMPQRTVAPNTYFYTPLPFRQ